MPPYSQEKLRDLRDQHRDRLRQRENYTGSHLTQDDAGNWLLAVQFYPLTDADRDAVREMFGQAPVEVREGPPAWRLDES